MNPQFDLREAINAISDVVQNRPRPIRDYDQIYMKAGDMVLQSEFVADWADKKRLAFIGDGDAIGVCVAYLQKREITDYGPSKIVVFDFDERIVQAVKRFADKERLDNLDAVLYNCLESFPQTSKFDYFYTNPPWGASNKGESVVVFTERGMEAAGYSGKGLVVIADDDDDDDVSWPREVLARTQSFAAENGFYVSKMVPRMHKYHLDDNPDLRSCNLIISSLSREKRTVISKPITDPVRLRDFYGRSKEAWVRYIREQKQLNYGQAHTDEYSLELLEGGNE